MSTPKLPPGPWIVEDLGSGFYVKDHNDAPVVTVFRFRDDPEEDARQKVIADFIAAAPELYATLKMIFNEAQHDNACDMLWGPNNCSCWKKKVEYALAEVGDYDP